MLYMAPASSERWVRVHANYEVSDLGRVRNSNTGHILVPMRTGTKRAGSQRSKVRFSTKPRIDADVAHLVLEAFIGPRPEGLIAMHADDDSSNNALSNLSWGTHADNANDMVERGRGGNQKLTLAQRREIGQRRAAGEPGVALAKEYGVSAQRICDVWREMKKPPMPCDTGGFNSLTKGKRLDGATRV